MPFVFTYYVSVFDLSMSLWELWGDKPDLNWIELCSRGFMWLVIEGWVVIERLEFPLGCQPRSMLMVSIPLQVSLAFFYAGKEMCISEELHYNIMLRLCLFRICSCVCRFRSSSFDNSFINRHRNLTTIAVNINDDHASHNHSLSFPSSSQASPARGPLLGTQYPIDREARMEMLRNSLRGAEARNNFHGRAPSLSRSKTFNAGQPPQKQYICKVSWQSYFTPV